METLLLALFVGIPVLLGVVWTLGMVVGVGHASRRSFRVFSGKATDEEKKSFRGRI